MGRGIASNSDGRDRNPMELLHPLRRARTALLVGDVTVLGATLSGGGAALMSGRALLQGLSVGCRGNLAGFGLSAAGRA